MKKTLIALLCLVAVLLTAGLGACTKTSPTPADDPTAPPATEAPGETPTDEPVAGGYTEDREPTEDELAILTEALEGTDGVTYEATLVATQVVAGTNYRFTATATAVTPDAEPYEVYIFVFVNLEGEVELKDIETIEDDGGETPTEEPGE